jgi:hypothetical protein
MARTNGIQYAMETSVIATAVKKSRHSFSIPASREGTQASIISVCSRL